VIIVLYSRFYVKNIIKTLLIEMQWRNWCTVTIKSVHLTKLMLLTEGINVITHIME